MGIKANSREGSEPSLLENCRTILMDAYAANELNCQSEFLITFLDTIPHPVFYKDICGKYLGCNKAYEQFIGKRREEIIGRTVYEIGQDELAEEYETMDRDLFAHPGKQVYEWKVKLADGAERNVIFHKVTFNDLSGKIVGLIGIIQDITELIQTIDALRENRPDLLAIMKSSTESIVLTDTLGIVLEANETIAYRLRTTVERLKGKNLYAFFPPGVAENRRNMADKVIAEGKPFHFEDESGGFSILNSIYPVYDKEGKVEKLAIFGLDFTVLKKVADSVQKNKEIYQLTIETAIDGYVHLDLNGRILEVNEAYCTISGYTPEELLCMHISDLEANESYEQTCAHICRVIELGKDRFETKHCTKNGKILDIEVSTTYSEKAGPGFFCFFRDITESKLLESERKKAKASMAEEAIIRRIFIEKSRDGIFIFDENGHVYEVNRRFADMLGYHSEELLKLYVWDFDTQWTREQLLEAIQNREGEKLETIMQRKDGTFLNIEVSADRVLFRGQKLSFCVCRDITERKRAEEEMEKYKQIVSSTPDGISLLDTSYKYNIINDTYEQFSGKKREEIIGLTVAEFLGDSVFTNQIKDNFDRCLKGETVRYQTWIQYPKLGERFVDITYFPYLDKKSEIVGVVANTRDITDYKKAQEALQDSLQTSVDIIQTIPSGLFIYQYESPDRLILLESNPEAERLTGVTAKQSKGMELNDIWPMARATGLTDKYLKVIKTGTVFDIEDFYYKDEHIEGAFNMRVFRMPKNRLGVAFENMIERRQAELALKSSEKKFRNYVDTSPIGIVVINGKGNYVDINPAACRMVGYTSEELLSINCIDMIASPYTGFVSEHCSTLFEKGAISLRLNVLRKDGEIIYCQVDAVKLSDDFYLAFILDVTKQQKSHEQILLNEARLQSLVNILQRNFSSVQDLLDYALEEAIKLTESKRGYIYHYEEDKQQFILNNRSTNIVENCSVATQNTIFELESGSLLGEVVRQRKPIIVNDYQAHNPFTKNCSEEHVSLYKYMTIPLFEKGKIVTVVVVANKDLDYIHTDVLQLSLLMDSVWKVVKQRKTEGELKKTEERLLLAMEASDYGFWDLNLDTKEMYYSPQIYSILGLEDGEVHSNIFMNSNLFCPDDKEYILSNMARAANGTSPLNFDCRLRLKSGEYIWVSIKGKPFDIDEMGVPHRFVGTLTNITSRLKAEEALLYAKAAANESNRIRSEILKNVTHELKTPLTAVIGFSDLMLEPEHINLNDSQRRYLQHINKGGKDLLETINKILDFSRYESAELGNLSLEKISVKQLVYETIDVLLPQSIKKNQIIDIRICSDIPDILADEYKLKQILYNLLENAIKFTGEKGSIIIEVSSQDDMLEFSVCDNGIGISKESLDRIFEPFIQIDGSISRKYGGTGMGLALVRKLVELHDGSIHIESEPDKGSKFIFKIPLNPKA